jgi:hypothetical protein
MALPIRPTPVLRGRDARRFIREVRANENKPVSRAEYERAHRVYAAMKDKVVDR